MNDITAETPAVAPSVTTFELVGIEGEQSFDCALIPADARLDLLKGAVVNYVRNRVNQALIRHNKDEAVIAWTAYDNAQKADPMQAVVARPTTERPVAELTGAMARAIDALTKGEIRKLGTGEPKARAKVDPLTKTITDIVVREVYESKHAADGKYTYINARAEVGKDGLAFLNASIEAKVLQGVDRAALEKMRDTKYVNPAKMMLGITDSKATKDLPSLL